MSSMRGCARCRGYEYKDDFLPLTSIVRGEGRVDIMRKRRCGLATEINPSYSESTPREVPCAQLSSEFASKRSGRLWRPWFSMLPHRRHEPAGRALVRVASSASKQCGCGFCAVPMALMQASRDVHILMESHLDAPISSREPWLLCNNLSDSIRSSSRLDNRQ